MQRGFTNNAPPPPPPYIIFWDRRLRATRKLNSAETIWRKLLLPRRDFLFFSSVYQFTQIIDAGIQPVHGPGAWRRSSPYQRCARARLCQVSPFFYTWGTRQCSGSVTFWYGYGYPDPDTALLVVGVLMSSSLITEWRRFSVYIHVNIIVICIYSLSLSPCFI